ncbi:MAG: hypothetical protein M0R80_31720, partial [Proteobacteria bacterium]|nr:hypothetical protein [Pseudomonadota bacterium]
MDLDAEHAECQCLGNWDIAAECEECVGNWDVASGCASCLPGFGDVEDDDCGTCVRFVDAALADSGDGLTWSTAYTTIQAGIYSAGSAVTAVGGPEYCPVWVKAG